jgi:putative tryptophan/tyrosine transport system substrate-binding protein
MVRRANRIAVLKSQGAGLLLAIVAAALSLNAQADAIAVVLSDNAAPYTEVYEAVRVASGSEHNVTRYLAADQAGDSSCAASLIISTGVKATEAVIRNCPKTPLIATLVTRDWYVHGGQSQLAGTRPASAIFLDQPFSRQLRLIKEVLPEASRVGVVLSTAQSWQLRELQKQAQLSHMTIVEAVLGTDRRLVESLEKVLPDADMLLALPDPEVFNRNTAQTLFLTTYRYRVPVAGYSRSLTRAGALVSLYSSPTQIGQNAAEMAIRALSVNTIKLPPPQFPRYYSVSTNEHVARSMGIDLPDEASLLKRMQEGGERD